jgi:hypothetical protein
MKGVDVGNIVLGMVAPAIADELVEAEGAHNAIMAEAIRDVVAQDQAAMKVTVEEVEERFAHLALICRAIFELLQEKTGVTQRELVEKIVAVDLRDGKADSRMTPLPKHCPSCQSMMAPRFNRCLFCGYRDQSAVILSIL